MVRQMKLNNGVFFIETDACELLMKSQIVKFSDGYGSEEERVYWLWQTPLGNYAISYECQEFITLFWFQKKPGLLTYGLVWGKAPYADLSAALAAWRHLGLVVADKFLVPA